MDFPQASQYIPSGQPTEDFTRPKTNHNAAMGEKTINPTKSDSSQRKNEVTKKLPIHPPTSEMVMESIKTLKMKKGASVDAICEHIEATYDVNMKIVEPRLKKFLKNGVEKGLLEQVTGVGDKHRFKLKKTENLIKGNQIRNEIQKKEKIMKKAVVERKKQPK